MNDSENRCEGFAPIIGTQPKVLILGTMPSIQSLEKTFYYQHPRNAFWPIMGEFFQQPVTNQREQRDLIESHPLILWDVLASCQREGSLDSAIRSPQANDFEAISKQCFSLKTVLFNGQSAFQLFKRHVLSTQNLPQDWVFEIMPSTSPANARMRVGEKAKIWHQTLKKSLSDES